jgi:hypothetical protein
MSAVALAQYAALLHQLYVARAQGQLPLEQEYQFTIDFEPIWNQLTEDERAEVESMAEAYKRSPKAPARIGSDFASDESAASEARDRLFQAAHAAASEEDCARDRAARRRVREDPADG